MVRTLGMLSMLRRGVVEGDALGGWVVLLGSRSAIVAVLGGRMMQSMGVDL